jgi:hypothetical protein
MPPCDDDRGGTFAASFFFYRLRRRHWRIILAGAVAPAMRRSDGSWLAVRQARGIVISDSSGQPFSAAPILVSEMATRCSHLCRRCVAAIFRAQQFRPTIDLPRSMRLQCGHAAGAPIAAPRCGVTAEQAQTWFRSRDESAELFSQLPLEGTPVRLLVGV